MAAIVATNMQGSGVRAVTQTTLGASDTLTYNADRDPVLVLNNDSGGPLTVTIDGAGGTTTPVPGVGNVSVAAGYSTGAIADGSVVAIPLKTIEKYLQGVIAVTGDTGIKASLLEF